MKKLSYIVASLILAVIVTAGAGCELLPTLPPQTTPPPAASTSVTPIQPGFTIAPAPSPTSQTASLPSVADVVSRVKPSVVAISVEVPIQTVFGRTVQEGAGSGWIIDSNGIIVTNNHVVEGASKVTVALDDGRQFDADVSSMATDFVSDLAVIKINSSRLPAAKVGDSRALRVGDWVVAIGNSLGQGTRATVGIVSQQSVSVDVDGQTLSGLVETDAAINPGNSGGPLVNMAGEVIGITSVKIAEVGVEGVGYAIGTNEAAPLIQQLVTSGFVTRPFLGITMTFTSQPGVLLQSVQPGSPAEAAGLRAGDVITGFGGNDIQTVDELRQAIHQGQIGQSYEIVYQRSGLRLTTSATLVANSGQ